VVAYFFGPPCMSLRLLLRSYIPQSDMEQSVTEVNSRCMYVTWAAPENVLVLAKGFTFSVH